MKLKDKRTLILNAIEIVNDVVPNITNEKRIWDNMGIVVDKEGNVINQHLPFLLRKRGVTFLVNDDYKEDYKKWAIELWNLRDYGESNFSKEYVELFIHCLISDILKKGIDIVKQTPDEVIDIFDDFFQEHIVFIPIEGIEMEITKLEIGNIVFRKMTEDTANDITDQIEKYAFLSPFLKNTSVKFEKDFINELQNRTFAEFHTFAGDDISIQRAMKECEQVMDLLQYSVPFFHHRENNVLISPGIVRKTPYKAFVMGADIPSCYMKLDYTDLNYKLRINEDNIAIMEKTGVFKVSDMLKSTRKIKGLKKSLIQAIHWYANSQKQNEIENEFLSLMICLEIFFTPEKGVPITKSIAEGTTITITKGRKDENILEIRKKKKERIEKLYGKRSDVVHGRTQNIELQDVNDLREVCLTLIQHIINFMDEFEDINSLNNWIEEQKLKGF